MRALGWLIVFVGLMPVTADARQAPAMDAGADALRALVPAGDATVRVDAAGLSRSGRRAWAVEPVSGGDAARPTLVIVGGLDGPASASIARDLVRWWFGNDAAALRKSWNFAALPCALPEVCDGDGARTNGDTAASPTFPPSGGFFDGKTDPAVQHAWRWITFQAPTLVVEIRAGQASAWQANPLASALAQGATPAAAGSLAAALAEETGGAAWSRPVPALVLTAASSADAARALGQWLPKAERLESPLRGTLLARQRRAPLDVARLIAPLYPARPIMSYIPALSWAGGLRLAQVTGETRFRDKPLADMGPFLSGARAAIAEPYLLTSLAGHLAFSDLGELDSNQPATELARKAAAFIEPESADQIVRFATQWTDDMFMATSVLARVAGRNGDDRAAATATKLLTSYVADLQRADGLFIHAKAGPHTWGRGNGFAAFGLMDALTHLPASTPERPRLLESFRALMKGLAAHQAPDGLWRQVVDEPGSYREFTVTAMTIAAMARGVNNGWLDASYRPVVDRAWHGLLARIGEDGTLMDVCTGTGSGPTKQYYLERAGLTGGDDRGGAMALTAALEMAALPRD